MNYTENYQLPQWEKTDRILMEDFNGAFLALDNTVAEKCGIVVGTYTGNGAESREISLGKKPKLVYTTHSDAGLQDSNYGVYRGFAAPGWSTMLVSMPSTEITETGFRVFSKYSDDYGICTNSKGSIYYYIAVI